MNNKIVYLLAIFITIYGTHGQVIVSEIMYNPAGNDAGREWIEIYNRGNTSVNIEAWKLKESGTNRSFTLEQGSYVMNPGDAIIIVKNYSAFLNDYPEYNNPEYNKSVVRCSFAGLVNTGGEELTLFDSFGNAINSVFYSTFAPEGHSIEIVDCLKDNTNMENWIVGKYKGEPGSIICPQESEPEQEIPEKEVPDQQDNENHDKNPTQNIPEFNLIGTSLILLLSIGFVLKRAKTF